MWASKYANFCKEMKKSKFRFTVACVHTMRLEHEELCDY
jgi:hypothetical protein